MHYDELSVVQPRLRAPVECLYRITSDAPTGYFCVPNGKVGVSLRLRGHARYVDATGAAVPIGPMILFGMVERPTPVFMSADFVGLTAVIRPAWLQAFLREPVGRLLNRPVGLDGVWGSAADRLYADLRATDNVVAQQRQLEAFLLRHYVPQPDPRIDAALAQLRAQPTQLTVDALSRQLRVTGRTLHTLFSEKIGISPKRYLRLLRFYHALTHQPDPARPHTLTQHALEAGYYDQSHFIREFRRFARRPPGAYFRNEPLCADFRQYRRWLRPHFLQR